jgi:hypothetical protein
MDIWCDDVAAEKWNPLEDGPLPDYVPPLRWDGTHVIKRFTEAIELVKRTPLGRIFPKETETCWPTYPSEFDAFMARMTADAESMAVEGKLDQEFVAAYQLWKENRNRWRDIPNREQLSQMEQALAWRAQYLLPFPEMRVAFSCYCQACANGIEPRRVYFRSQSSRTTRINHRDIPSLARAGAAVIARGLNNDQVPVY